MEDMFTITLQTLEEDIEQMTIDVHDQVKDKASIKQMSWYISRNSKVGNCVNESITKCTKSNIDS